jgi:hypothetical protein
MGKFDRAKKAAKRKIRYAKTELTGTEEQKQVAKIERGLEKFWSDLKREVKKEAKQFFKAVATGWKNFSIFAAIAATVVAITTGIKMLVSYETTTEAPRKTGNRKSAATRKSSKSSVAERRGTRGQAYRGVVARAEGRRGRKKKIDPAKVKGSRVIGQRSK